VSARTDAARPGQASAALGTSYPTKARDALLVCTVGRASVEARSGTGVPARNSTLSKRRRSTGRPARHDPPRASPGRSPASPGRPRGQRSRRRAESSAPHSPGPPARRPERAELSPQTLFQLAGSLGAGGGTGAELRSRDRTARGSFSSGTGGFGPV